MYDTAFFAGNVPSGLSGAPPILPWVLKRTKARRVIDIGCATGAWLSVAKAYGCEVRGVDGFAPEEALLIDESEFEKRDLSNGYDCSGFDLALCTEVGEHLPESAAAPLVAGLCRARYVLFGAAIPGQEGTGHINEQWQSWWAALFAEHGYSASLAVRWTFWADDLIDVIYRQNIVLYARSADLAAAGVLESKVTDVVHPFLFMVRHR